MDTSSSIGRSNSPIHSSTSISTHSSSDSESSSHSEASDGSNSTAASGSFAVGLRRSTQDEASENGSDGVSVPAAHADSQPTTNRPSCPQPVLWLIRSIGFVMGAGGLGGMIYGGLGTSFSPGDARFPERDKAMALMASSTVVMFVGICVGMATGQRQAATVAPVSPA